MHWVLRKSSYVTLGEIGRIFYMTNVRRYGFPPTEPWRIRLCVVEYYAGAAVELNRMKKDYFKPATNPARHGARRRSGFGCGLCVPASPGACRGLPRPTSPAW